MIWRNNKVSLLDLPAYLFLDWCMILRTLIMETELYLLTYSMVQSPS